MHRTVLVALLALTVVTGCSTPLTERAAQVRVIPHDTVAQSGCKMLGSVAGRSRPVLLESAARSEAMSHLLDAAARMDADTVAVVDSTVVESVVTVRGVALKCF